MNVLKITSTPIKLSMTSQRARLESRLPDPEVGIIRNPGKLNMKSDHIKVDIDTSRSRDSLGFKTARGLMKDAASAGLKAASDATAQYSRVGNQMMQIQDGVTVSGIIKNQMMAQTNVVTGIAFIPSVGPDISWDAGELNIRYEMDKLNFDWRIGNGDVEFIPGDIEFTVTQRPDVIIKYIGGPVYVPPSAEPGYEPLDETV